MCIRDRPALWLGWHPTVASVLGSLPLLVLVAVAFTGLGLLIAGTLRAEATLAVLNVCLLYTSRCV